jgi:hypothetical protein
MITHTDFPALGLYWSYFHLFQIIEPAGLLHFNRAHSFLLKGNFLIHV